MTAFSLKNHNNERIGPDKKFGILHVESWWLNPHHLSHIYSTLYQGSNWLTIKRLTQTRLSIRFIPGPSILAIKWTFNGAILYFQVMKVKLIHVGQRIGTIHWQPFEQPGKMQPSSHSIRFHT